MGSLARFTKEKIANDRSLWRRSGLMVSALIPGASGLGSSPVLGQDT